MERYDDRIANEQQYLADKEQSGSEDGGNEQNLQLSTLSSNWCLTSSEAVVCPFVWAIENLSFYLGKDDNTIHRSSRFVDPLKTGREWYLSMESRKKADKDRQTLFTIRMISEEVSTLKGKIHFSFLDSYGKCLIDKEGEDICTFTGNDQGWSWNIPYKYLTEMVNGELKSSSACDRFIIRCQVTILSNAKTVDSCKRKKRFEIAPCQIVENLGVMYGSPKYADLMIIVSGVTLTAHKVVVASQSPVFAAMLAHDTKEAQESRIIIEDISADVFKQLLAFMYTGKVVAIDENPVDLLVAANKYGLDRLKCLCEQALSSQLTVSNSAAMLILADMHNANQLKDFIIDFINKFPNEVLNSDGWTNLARSNGLLISEVFCILMAKSQPSRGNSTNSMPSKRKTKSNQGDYYFSK